MVNPEIEICYLHDAEASENEYKALINTFNNCDVYEKYLKRQNWYRTCCDHNDCFRIVVAKYKGKLVGQGCAFKVKAIVHGKEEELWWGCDAFVLSEARGLGIGTKIQKKLHHDCPNFSSAEYSPTNGHVKIKCGSRKIFNLYKVYYPSSRYFSLLFDLIIRKLLKKEINFSFSFKGIYSNLNRCSVSKYEIKDIKFTDNVINFINKCLNDHRYDFYIKRDKAYLKWKYEDNPNLRYNMISVDYNGDTKAIIIFTEISKFYAVVQRIRGVKVLDVFTTVDSNISQREVLYIIYKYYQQKGMYFDGFLSLQNVKYYPKLLYPYPHSDVLSTMITEPISKPYIAYSDHDMEQM